ncbi:uncharacterized protein PV07_08006 [Cladophialophora immunda]|uniref:Uncharacterized protein n=1 Tax=Cladophialophora immunda TaxID=569365 RepID=A0A0D2CBA4_9EURO|nr:uncharacterized protein PV07_08006 [Cladophialophora immunda]KIW28333.1 hypothetical protein PV07_08006 [Cladophialophora immunda]
MDTRCADSEIQLDVDLMVLEYTLFQAIEAQLSVLSRGGFQDERAGPEPRRVLAIFESFLEVFKHNHPSYEQSPEFNFRLEILRVLILLLCHYSPVISTDRLTEDVSAALDSRAMSDLMARRRWLARRERDPRRGGEGFTVVEQADQGPAWDLEQQIYSAWHSRSSHHASRAPQHTRGPLLFSLLPRFMAISACFVDFTNQGPSDIWMDVACEFMLQAGLESLRLRGQNGTVECLPKLEDRFAWGYNFNLDESLNGDAPHTPPTPHHNDETAEMVNNLFRLRQDEDIGLEHPDWTQLRIDTLHEFSVAADASAQSQSRRLEHLADKYPRADFQQRLAGLVQDMWNLSCRAEVLGKPVLVEIEEGHVKSLGLEGADFDQFAARVGLTEGFDEIEDCILEKAARGPAIGREQSLKGTYEYQRERERRRQEGGIANGA